MSHLETLIAEFLEWRGYLVRKNIKVNKLKHGGWAMELDIVGYHPETKDLVHYEPSLDAHTWQVREARFRKKFAAGKAFINIEVFPWLPKQIRLRQIAVLPVHPTNRNMLAGATIQSIDEFSAEVCAVVMKEGPMRSKAISEQYPLLRTIQMTRVGYMRMKPS